MNIRYPIYEGVYRILTIGQDFQSRSRLHTIFASENDDDFGGKLF